MMRPDPARMIDAGQVLTALRREGGASPELRSLSLDRAWPWRDGGLCALYLEPPERSLARAWAVVGPVAGRPPVGLRRAAASSRPRLLPSISACAWPLAADPELIASADILAAPRAAERLRSWLPDGPAASAVRVRALRYKPLRRLMVEYRARRADGSDWRIYGKALRSRDLGRIEQIYRRLAGVAGGPDLAAPSGVVRPWNLIVFEARPGVELDRLIPGPAAGRGVSLAGESLAALHTCGAPLAATHGRRREAATLDRWLDSAAPVFPELAARLRFARRALEGMAAGLAAGPPCPSHRDFHPGQLLVTREGSTILDLDTAAAAEPELDAGNFLAHLDLLELESETVAAARLSAAFCDAYERRAGRRLDSRRLLWYRAAALLRLACVHRFRSRGAILGPFLVHRCLELMDSGVASLEVY